MAPSSFVAAALAVVSLAGHVQATEWDLPLCTSPFQPFVYSGCFQDAAEPNNALSFRSHKAFDTMTVENCVAECKGNGYRYAGLEYMGECFCGQTVGGIQLNETSCSMTCQGNSSQTCGGSYALSIYQDPTFQTYDDTVISDYVSLGCWTDNAGGPRALGYLQPNTVSGSNLTTESCLQACKKGGFPFAGTEYSSECWCGVVIANGTESAPDGDCGMPCSGNADQTCGGSARLSMYVAKDLESLQPCGNDNTASSSTSTSATVSTSSSSSSSSTSSAAAITSSSTTSSAAAVTSSSSTSSTAAVTTSSSTSSAAAVTSSSSSPSSTSTTQGQATTASSTSTSCTTTTKAATTTAPATTTIVTTTTKAAATTTSAAVCTTTTVIPPTCEYKCGNWCSSPLPEWNDQTTCYNGHSSCAIQVAACFKTAGWPGSMSCFDFSAWCGSVKSYCKASGSKSKSDCLKSNAPKGGNSAVTSTITVPCAATTSTAKPTTTSTQCPIPTPTGICAQPSSDRWGYGPGNPVGGIELAVVTCNDLKGDFAQNPFKVYTDSDSSKCSSFSRGNVPSACSSACKAQYDQCTSTYAKGCQENQQSGKTWGFGISTSVSVDTSSIWSWLSSLFGKTRRDLSYFEYAKASAGTKRTLGWSDSYNTANNKCQAQYNDCLSTNKGVSGSGKCGSWGSGW